MNTKLGIALVLSSVILISGCIRVGGGTGTDTIAQVDYRFINITTVTFVHGGHGECNCYILPHELVSFTEEARMSQRQVVYTFNQELMTNLGDPTNYRVTSMRYN